MLAYRSQACGKWPFLAAALLAVAGCGAVACGGAPGQKLAASGAPSAPSQPSDPPASGGAPASARLFPNAAWLYKAPSGRGVDISYLHAKLSINDHRGGFDYPIQTADGSNGYQQFSDKQGDSNVSVPVPDGGFQPSVGGWGYNDGHLVVIDHANDRFYDFWKLYTNAGGQPTSHQVGKIVSGPLDGEGNPGTTAAVISGAAGDLLPGELQNGVNHALSCIVPGNWNNSSIGDQGPAVETDGRRNGPLSEGGKIGVDPGLNIDALPNLGADTKTILKTFQKYGCVITDQNGSSNVIGIYSALSNLDNLDLRGMSDAGQYLRFYF